MINVEERHLKEIKTLLKQYVPGAEVRVFGSRLNETVKTYADLDLALVGKKKIPGKIMAQLKEAFEESTIPFRVDLLDWQTISDSFRKIIENSFEVLQQPQN
ncbi:MAG: nucleotidyltransferase domain-containing protein [bacterium]